MPRPRKPARLWQRKDGAWIILDSGQQFGTGGARGERDRELAEEALAAHIAGRGAERTGPAQPSEITVGEVLARYIRDCGPEIADPARLGDAAKALSPFWSDQTCDAVKGSTCRAYAKYRAKSVTVTLRGKRGGEYKRTTSASPSTVRRELGVLQRALNYCHSEGIIIYAPQVTLPAAPDPKDDWMTRKEVADRVRAARASGHKGLARFILIGVYTGTRPGAILRLRTTASLTNGYADLESGVLYRKGATERSSKKRREPCRLPLPLLAHMRRWARSGEFYVEAKEGGPIKDIGCAWRTAGAHAKAPHRTPHVVKSTAVTWFFQNRGTMEDAVSFFCTTAQTLERVYRQHHPDFQAEAARIMARKR